MAAARGKGKGKKASASGAASASRKTAGKSTTMATGTNHELEQQLINLRRRVAELTRECQIDDDLRERVEASVSANLAEAVGQYGFALSGSTSADHAACFRVVSLWFASWADPDIHGCMRDSVVRRVPSYKFLPLLYQLTSRFVSTGGAAAGSHTDPTTNAAGAAALEELVVRLGADHPHHCVPQLLALANASAGVDGGATDHVYFANSDAQARVQRADGILDMLSAKSAEAGELIGGMRTLSKAYIMLAMLETDRWHGSAHNGKPIALSESAGGGGIKGVKPLHTCLPQRLAQKPAVMTLAVAVDRTGAYADVVRVDGFVKTFEVTESGVHRPCIVWCLGSDGRKYRQLVKGKDDTRQDAIMQQVFELVNTLLNSSAEARERALHVRTYRIVPLSSQAGLIEWVERTMVFGGYLVASKTSPGAHERYRPDDLTTSECRKLLRNEPPARLRQAYDKVCTRFRPALRWFFVENFPSPATWYARTLAYTRSVAAASIVGHVLGIGDRHASNILLDTVSAEVVHIDFGICFEMGHCLPTPETVPFRLTRDIVDGMGVAGTEGPFTRCCETTCRVLRANTRALRTILEVTVHDPLYRWVLTPIQAREKQAGRDGDFVESDDEDGGDGAAAAAPYRGGRGGGGAAAAAAAAPAAGATATTAADSAERVLMRIQQKVEGYEDGGLLSVEGQVSFLIRQATDPDNLAKLYVGWQSWL